MQLDKYQRAAIDSNAQFLQVVGYPGTGKTLVLANRIARLIEDGVEPESIVALTFTNSSCMALRRSIARNLEPKQVECAEAVRINTYHSFCHELIKEHPEDVGLTSEWDLTDFLDVYNMLFYPAAPPPIGAASTTAATAGPAARRHRLHSAQDVKDHTRRILTDFKAYDFDQALKFGEKIINAHDLGISHVVIDEFQDCTSMQWELVRAILRANPEINLTVAGDPNQEIFNFQENHLDHAIEKMVETYPETEVLFLRNNYRSTQQIIDTFQEIVQSGARDKYTPDLVAMLPDGKEPTLNIYGTQIEERQGILHLIKKLCNGEKEGSRSIYKFDDVAILVRLNVEAQLLTDYLREHGIPAKHELGIRGFGARRMTSLALTLMKWSLSSKDFYLIQLLYNRFHRFVSDKELQGLLQQRPSDESLLDALTKMNPEKYTQHPFLIKFLPGVRDELLACKTPVEVMEAVERAVVSWRAAAGSRAKSNAVNFDHVAWVNFLQAMRQGSREIKMDELSLEEQSQQGAALAAMLKYLFARDKPTVLSQTDGMVSISTIHSAKSNEWPVVILPGDPQYNYRTPKPSDLDAERRLQYVAASRARRELYFTNAGAVRNGSRNSFLNTKEPDAVSKLLSPAEAVKRNPLVFEPIRATRRLNRIVKL